jgi:hypothetical protein
MCTALRSAYLVIHFVKPDKWVTASNKGLVLPCLAAAAAAAAASNVNGPVGALPS